MGQLRLPSRERAQQPEERLAGGRFERSLVRVSKLTQWAIREADRTARLLDGDVSPRSA